MIVTRTRIIVIISSIFYLIVFKYTYKITISPKWDYFGLGFSPPPLAYEILSFLFGIIPLFWAPVSFFRPSVILYYVQYSLVYVPTLLVCYHVNKPNLNDFNCLILCTFIFLGMLILTLCYHFPVRKIRPAIQIKQTYDLTYFALFLSLTMLLFVGLKSGSSLGSAFETSQDSSMVGQKIFENANASRGKFSSSASALGGKFFVYSIFWLSGFFLPLIFAYGIFMKRKLNFLLFFLGYIFLFVFAGYKSCMVALVSLPAVWFFLSRKSNGPAQFILGCGIFLLISNIFNIEETRYTLLGAWASMLSNWVNLRIFCIAPLTIVQFLDFFDSNPLTFMSHVKGFNLLIEYPYTQDIGRYVGRFHYGGGINVNSGLWATDGIAAFGIFGIIISSIICSFVFWVLDSASVGLNPKFVSLSLGFIAMTFPNTSLFTNIITGGLFLVLLNVYLLPDKIKIKTWPKKFFKYET